MSKRKSKPHAAGTSGKPGAQAFGRARPRNPKRPPREPSKPSGGRYWLYGQHACRAALLNGDRRIHRLVYTGELDPTLKAGASVPPENLHRDDLAVLLPPGAVHQGLAVETQPLDWPALEVFCDALQTKDTARMVVLDQATDPQNIGAVLRSAAAFGADAVVVQDRHAPEETGAMAKAASGALEVVPLLRATNLARALGVMKAAGFWCLGLAGEGEIPLAQANLAGRVGLVLGAEGAGLRRLVAENCDHLVRIPINPAMESLNLSNACAVALYELARQDA